MTEKKTCRSEADWWERHYSEYKYEQADDDMLRIPGALLQMPEPIANMLDVGCGTGELVRAWASCGVVATGLDIAAHALRIARCSTAQAVSEHCKWVLANWQEVCLREFGWERAFDLVYSGMGPDPLLPEVLNKMIAASRRYVRVLVFNHGKSDLAEVVASYCGVENATVQDDGEQIRRRLTENGYAVDVQSVRMSAALVRTEAEWAAYFHRVYGCDTLPVLRKLRADDRFSAPGGMKQRTVVRYSVLTWEV